MTRTLSEENYLKAIFHLSRNSKDKVSITTLAAAIENTAASVISMLRKLTAKELVDYDKKKGASLTHAGEKVAIDIVRKHRLWEVLLAEKLEFSWEEIHDIAEQLEHVHHPELADRLDKFLGFPAFDPHGHPIPDIKGHISKETGKLLSESATGLELEVVGVKDSSSMFLNYLKQLDIRIGSKLIIEQIIEFDQSAVIKINNGNTISVSRKFLESILIS
ncbi:MAG: metal-dependent transcriptional regulator [Bacteroidota bacterium]